MNKTQHSILYFFDMRPTILYYCVVLFFFYSITVSSRSNSESDEDDGIVFPMKNHGYESNVKEYFLKKHKFRGAKPKGENNNKDKDKNQKSKKGQQEPTEDVGFNDNIVSDFIGLSKIMETNHPDLEIMHEHLAKKVSKKMKDSGERELSKSMQAAVSAILNSFPISQSTWSDSPSDDKRNPSDSNKGVDGSGAPENEKDKSVPDNDLLLPLPSRSSIISSQTKSPLELPNFSFIPHSRRTDGRLLFQKVKIHAVSNSPDPKDIEPENATLDATLYELDQNKGKIKEIKKIHLTGEPVVKSIQKILSAKDSYSGKLSIRKLDSSGQQSLSANNGKDLNVFSSDDEMIITPPTPIPPRYIRDLIGVPFPKSSDSMINEEAHQNDQTKHKPVLHKSDSMDHLEHHHHSTHSHHHTHQESKKSTQHSQNQKSHVHSEPRQQDQRQHHQERSRYRYYKDGTKETPVLLRKEFWAKFSIIIVLVLALIGINFVLVKLIYWLFVDRHEGYDLVPSISSDEEESSVGGGKRTMGLTFEAASTTTTASQTKKGSVMQV